MKPQPLSVGVFSCPIAPKPACLRGLLRKPADFAGRPIGPFPVTFRSLLAILLPGFALREWPEVRRATRLILLKSMVYLWTDRACFFVEPGWKRNSYLVTASHAVALGLMKTCRIATWNLDGYRSNAASRLPQQIEVLQNLLADIVVLTEVRDTTLLPGKQFWWSDAGQPPYKPRDRAVGIASTWTGRSLKVRDSRLSACVSLDAPSPLGRVIVYGTVSCCRCLREQRFP